MLSHQDDQGIHEQRELAIFSSPGNLHMFYSAVCAFCARDATVDIGLKLKKVQVTPGSFESIMCVAAWFAAFRARKFAARFKIRVDIELFFFGTKIY
jgi:hypothetical protein